MIPGELARYCSVLVLVLMTVTCAIPAESLAQQSDPGELGLKYAESVAGNAQALRAYIWQERVEVKRRGEVLVTVVQQLRYSEGELQSTLISQEPKKPGGNGPKNKKKREGYEACVRAAQSITKLLASYVMMTSGQTVDFFSNGKMTPEEEGDERATRIEGNDVLQKGDSVMLLADLAGNTPRRMNITTMADGKLVKAKMDFASLADGPYFMSLTHVSMPDQEFELKIENYDHVKQDKDK